MLAPALPSRPPRVILRPAEGEAGPGAARDGDAGGAALEPFEVPCLSVARVIRPGALPNEPRRALLCPRVR